MKKFLSILLSALLCLSLIGCSNSKNNKTLYTNYLKKNCKDLNLEDTNNYSTFRLLNSDAKTNDMFLLGEDMTIKTNFEIPFRLIEYFKLKTNFKYILTENDFASSIYLDKYINTGNNDYLKKVYRKDTDYYKLWNKIYNYNMTLKKEYRLKVIGIGYDSNVSNKYILDLLKSKNYDKDNIICNLNHIQNDLTSANFLNAKTKMQDCYKTITANKNDLKNILGKDYFNFDMSLKNLKDFIEGKTEQSNLNKGKIMYSNFEKIYNNIPSGKYFGFMNLNCTLQKNIIVNSNGKKQEIKPFASYLNSGKFKGKVLSIATLYDNSISPQIKINPSYKTGQVFDNYLTSDCILFKLNNKNSPYFKNLKSDFINKDFLSLTNGVTTDYFQYLIIVRNSKKLNPIKNAK